MEHFIKDLKNTGAVVPCSDVVGQTIINYANLKQCQTVVELGPGTGVITKKIIENISSDTLLLALELNAHFAEETKRKYPQAIVYHDSAENIKFYLEKHGCDTCDCIISTLPWTLFGEENRIKILQAIVEALKPGGEFFTVSYTFTGILPAGIHLRTLLRQHFSSVYRTKPIWKNFPPVHLFCCKK